MAKHWYLVDEADHKTVIEVSTSDAAADPSVPIFVKSIAVAVTPSGASNIAKALQAVEDKRAEEWARIQAIDPERSAFADPLIDRMSGRPAAREIDPEGSGFQANR